MNRKSLVTTKWKTISKKLLIQNKFINLWHDKVLLPNGKKADYYLLRKDPFSVIIPLEKDHVYMTRQYRYTVGKVSTEFPMGYVKGKNPKETAITELKEETGATAAKIRQIGKFWLSVGRSNQEGYTYVAEGLQFGNQELEEGEFIEVERMSIKEIEKMIEEGKILDSQTITSFHFLKTYIEKNMNSNKNW